MVWIFLIVAMAACGSGQIAADEPSDVLGAKATEACPVLDSRDWAAVLDTGDETQLVITGSVTMPTPGYKFSWEEAMTDRSREPKTSYKLIAVAPQGMVTQVLSERTVTYRGPVPANIDQTVVVMCGDRTLAEIQDLGHARDH